MPVVHNEAVEKFALPGLEHQTLAGPEHGMQTLEMWMQTIKSGSGTPVHRHDCEEAIVVLRGSGRLTVEGEDMGFRSELNPPDTTRCDSSDSQYRNGRYVHCRGSRPGTGQSLHRRQ